MKTVPGSFEHAQPYTHANSQAQEFLAVQLKNSDAIYSYEIVYVAQHERTQITLNE